MSTEGQQDGSCAGGNALYLDCINISVLDVTLNYGFTSFPMGRNWIKRTVCMISHN